MQLQRFKIGESKHQRALRCFPFFVVHCVGGQGFKISWRKTEPPSTVEVTKRPKGFLSHTKTYNSIGSLERVIL